MRLNNCILCVTPLGSYDIELTVTHCNSDTVSTQWIT